ncbi:MAG: biopolymer transporter ExbD [Pseudomonadota bacterium]
MARRHSEQQDDTEINITPMLDIVFIMLIFFIVTTSFVKETGIDPVRPEAETAAAKPSGNILIGVTEQGDIWFNKRQIELSRIRLRVEEATSESPESSAVIIADQGAPTGVVIDIMDQVRLGGVIDISIAAKRDGT